MRFLHYKMQRRFLKMEEGSPIWGLAVFGLLVALLAIVNGFGAAIQNLNGSELERRAEEGEKKAKKAQKIAEHPTEFINTMLTTVFIVSMVTGIYEYRLLQRMIRHFFVSVQEVWNPLLLSLLVGLIPALCLLVLVMVFGVLVPKKLGNQYAERWVFVLLNPVIWLCILLRPITAVVTFCSNLLVRMFGINPYEDYDNVTEEDIMSMVNEGHEQGVLLASEAEMITNIFEFGDKEASDIMTHRKHIVAADEEWTLKETVEFILQENNSRFPVYKEDIDNIVGILYLKDAMIYYQQHPMDQNRKVVEIKELMREAHFIPETRNINLLFKEMQSKKIHMAIVVDEYGQTAGLVTMEDILEEIVGNILDEYDEEEEKMIEEQEDGSYLIHGMAGLNDVADKLGIRFGEEEYDTLNGFLTAQIDRIPQEDDVIDIFYGGYEFRVLQIENKTIRQVSVRKAEEIEGDCQEEKEVAHHEESC